MATNYNTIAQQYKKAKQQPWRLHVEQYTLFKLIGDLAGRSVLDLACGEGFHTRELKRSGAARVVGVDLSERMVELATAEEAREPLGIDYQVGDAKRVDFSERFDLVAAGYLLNYAQNADELLAMCQAISRNLKPGGRFVSVNNNPAQPPSDFNLSVKYGFAKLTPGPLVEESPVIYRFFLDDGDFSITNYHLSVATHEWAFRQAGFSQVNWRQPIVSPEGTQEWGPDYWRDFLEHSPVIFFDCVK